MATKKPAIKTPPPAKKNIPAPAKKVPAKVPAKKVPVKVPVNSFAPAKKVPAKKVAPPPVKKPPVKKPVPPVEDFDDGPMPKPPKFDDEDMDLPTVPPEPEGPPPLEDLDSPPSRPDSPDTVDPGSKIDKEKLLSFIEDVIDTLSFKRVGLIALLTVIGLAIFSLYENRVSIVEKIVSPEEKVVEAVDATAWELSEKSKKSLEELTKSTPVNFVVITGADLKKNRRNAKYYYTDDPTMVLSPDALRALSLPQAFFDYDAKNTAQMVSILSNEFRCDPYQDTINFRYAPELKDKIPTVCRMAIPPFVGQFVGFIAVGIAPHPGGPEGLKGELDSIRLEMSRLAVEIYMNDVIKNTASPPATSVKK